MPLSIFYDRCQFSTSTTGTSDFVVGSAITGMHTPAQASVPNGTTGSYAAESADQTEWESGQGVYLSGTTTVVRLSIDNSSNGGAKVNFTNVARVVFGECLARDLNDMLSGASGEYLTTGAGDPLTTGAGVGLTTG